MPLVTSLRLISLAGEGRCQRAVGWGMNQRLRAISEEFEWEGEEKHWELLEENVSLERIIF